MAASIPPPTLEEFLACCDAEFGFLVREHGFVRSDEPKEYNPFSVRFLKGELGVEIYGENWGESASCDLVRGGDWLYLGLMVPAEQRGSRKHKGARRGQLDQVRAWAALLRLHAADFLRGEFSRFDAAVAEWKRVTRPRPMTEAHRQERERAQALTAAGHASKREDHAEVVRLLEPYEKTLSPHQRRMLDAAREQLGR